MTPLALALALTLRGYAQTAPSLMRPHLAAAADAVEEIARLRAECDEARALLRKLAISEITITPGVLHQYRCRACGWRWSGRPTDPQQHKDGCLAALKGDEK